MKRNYLYFIIELLFFITLSKSTKLFFFKELYIHYNYNLLTLITFKNININIKQHGFRNMWLFT